MKVRTTSMNLHEKLCCPVDSNEHQQHTYTIFYVKLTKVSSKHRQIRVYLSRGARKPVFGVSDPVRHKLGCTKPQKMTRGLTFRILVVERLYCLCSQTKGVDQLLVVKLNDRFEFGSDLHKYIRDLPYL